MSLILDAMRRRKLLGATVSAFQVNGCMGHEHQLLWLGRIERFEERWGLPHIVVTLFYVADGLYRSHRDIRDGDLGVEYINLHDSSLQELYRGNYAFYR